MFCENCGIDLQVPNQKFCPNCGIPLRKGRIVLDPKKVLVSVDGDFRKIFIWKGSNSPVLKRFIGARIAQELQVKYPYCKIVSVDQGNEPSEFLKAFGMRSNDNEGSGSPFIFKPPTPPGDLSPSREPQVKQPIKKEEEDYEPYCKHCGSKLPEGQTICHVCGKKVI